LLRKFTFLSKLIIRQSFVLVIFLFPSLLRSQSSLKFELLTADDGLSHNKVQCILQDAQGYLWFGTVYGLNRYDGYTFKVFENVPGDPSTLADNDIIGLYQDHKGIIWIGTSTVLSSYDPRTEKFSNYNLPALHGWIHDFAEDNDTLWLATGTGLFAFNRANKKISYIKTDGDGKENIQSILKDKNDKNIFWLSTETGIRKFNKQTGTITNYAFPFPAFDDFSREITHNIIQDSIGNFYTTTTAQGIYKLDAQTQQLISYNLNNLPAVSNKISTELMEDADGKIWIGSEGLYIFDPSSNSFSFNNLDMNDAQGFPARVRTILKDKNGIYWVGTERGIAKYDPKLYSFITVKPNYPFTLQTANTIIEDKEHTFWAGTYIGLSTVDMNTGINKEANEILGETDAAIYTSLMDDDGSLWFGSKSKLFHLFKSQDRSWKSEKISLPVQGVVQVRSMTFDNAHSLWIGTNGGGLFRYDIASKTFETFMGDENNSSLFTSITISSLCSISKDNLLIATKGKGLVVMNTANRQFDKVDLTKDQEVSAINNSIINAVYKDHTNNIWIGTEGGGLWLTDEHLSTFKNYSVKNGLQSMSIDQVTEDDEDQIWLNTNIGLEIIDVLHNRFVQYSAKDGLSINQPDYLIKKSSGDLLRFDFNGLHIFRSSSINLNKDVPPIYINQMQVLDKTFPVYKDTVIYLKYDENYISFSYVALNYTQSFKNRYSYKLDGLDKKWVDAADRRFATYANIGSGTYTFHVKASNNNGVWNETGAKVTFIIDPPWWNTWWFYAFAIVFVGSIIYALFQFRLQQQIKAMEVRNTISRDLHDEVGSTLSSIGFLSSMAVNDADENNGKILNTLNSINESSIRMLDVMNDIIWNIQPKNDTVQNIIARMVSFASDILEAKKINLHINIADNITHLHLGLTERHNFYMIYKEAINNLAKYSAATEAWVSLEFKQPYLFLVIKDNGKGFDPSHAREGGNGLRNMKVRAEKIGAIYDLETVLNRGTTITVQLKPA
jgi:ligand-binding sensor domain-containing protein